MRLVLANTAIAGAVVYSMAIKSNAQPADFLASLTFLTVKNRDFFRNFQNVHISVVIFQKKEKVFFFWIFDFLFVLCYCILYIKF